MQALRKIAFTFTLTKAQKDKARATMRFLFRVYPPIILIS